VAVKEPLHVPWSTTSSQRSVTGPARGPIPRGLRSGRCQRRPVDHYRRDPHRGEQRLERVPGQLGPRRPHGHDVGSASHRRENDNHPRFALKSGVMVRGDHRVCDVCAQPIPGGASNRRGYTIRVAVARWFGDDPRFACRSHRSRMVRCASRCVRAVRSRQENSQARSVHELPSRSKVSVPLRRFVSFASTD
jgi:hypothetical protein